MAKKKQEKSAQKSAAKNKSSSAGKRQGQRQAAARTAPPRAPAKSADKGAGQKSKSNNVANVQSQKPEPKNTNKKAVGNIMKTTDGFLGNKPHIKKTRSVAIVDQRKSDGAVAVVKISKKTGKEEKIGKNFIPNLELEPSEHPALTETSIVGRQVIFGIKINGEFKPIFVRDLKNTNDKLTRKELKQIRKEVHNLMREHRKAYKKKRRKWKRRKFKK